MTVETIFECRCCGGHSVGYSDGTFVKLDWRRIDNIDGPNAICADCVEQEECLDHLIEDGYENASIRV